MRSFYEPTREQLSKLDTPWICSYSGGKDSTALVTWLEWLRRAGWITQKQPRLMLSDTGVEYPFLQEIAVDLMKVLTSVGWQCHVVKPEVRKKLYVQIFGRGVPPVSLSEKKMRWCTQATKISPMDHFSKTVKGLLRLSGVRWGESKVRDLKLLTAGCRAGGECGVPSLREGDDSLYGPVVNWTDCQVADWLNGHVVVDGMVDLHDQTRRLLQVYGYHETRHALDGTVSAGWGRLRFGCMGCPAVVRDKVVRKFENEHPTLRQINRLYGLWDLVRSKGNRVCRWCKSRKPPHDDILVYGPIQMEVRKRYFPYVLDIQRKANLTLVTEEDVQYIHWCWDNNVYPRGWSITDEGTKP